LATEQGLRFRGLIGYEGHCVRLPPGPAKTESIEQAMGKLVGTARLIQSHGLPVDIVSAGGTGTHAVSSRIPGVTEIQGGSYLLMDTDYQTVCPEFELALSVLGTVISRRGNERLILNIGLKEISGERGVPILKDTKGARVRKLNAEHAVVDILDSGFSAQVGDQLELWAHYSDATVNLHRRMFGIRNGKVEETFVLES
jgi:D-serine deaminase-like pyridoxal phosphate-dependent protein